MGLFGSSPAAATDAEVADALSRAVELINPLVTVLADVDLFGLKARTHQSGGGDGVVDRARDAAAWALNTVHAPGTRAWATMDRRHRVNWWVRRIGAANTTLVASPGSFGLLAAMLPVQDLLGFANQAIVVSAVAREYGVTDPGDQIRLLAEVLCDRTLDADVVAGIEQRRADRPHHRVRGPVTLTKTLWHLAAVLREIGGELGHRPRPKRIFRRLGALPGVGGVAGYLGEYGALRRAAKAAVARLDQGAAAHSVARLDQGAPAADGPADPTQEPAGG